VLISYVRSKMREKTELKDVWVKFWKCFNDTWLILYKYTLGTFTTSYKQTNFTEQILVNYTLDEYSRKHFKIQDILLCMISASPMSSLCANLYLQKKKEKNNTQFTKYIYCSNWLIYGSSIDDRLVVLYGRPQMGES